MDNPIPSRVLTGVSSLIESYGQSPHSIAERVAIEPEALYQADIMLCGVAINDLLEEAALACNDRFFSLRLAQLQSLDTLGPIWLAMRSSKTVGEMLQLLADNLESHSDAMSSYLSWDNSGATVSVEVRTIPGAASKPLHSGRTQVIELALALPCYELRRILGNHWRPEYAQWRCAAPEDPAPMRQVFGNNLHFNQDINGIYLSKNDLARPMDSAGTANQHILAHEPQSIPAHSVPFVVQVNRIIDQLINGEGCSACAVAAALGVNQRTMQYRLQQNQTSYQILYDTARLDLARHYLRKSDLSIAAVSERLKFTDSAAFSRFFKEKIGYSPREYAKRT